MYKKVLPIIGAVALVTTIGFSYPMKDMADTNKGHHGKMMKNRVLHMISMLSLSKEQTKNIEDITEKYSPKPLDMSSFFTENGFDKESYLKMMTEKKDERMVANANIISEVYAVLDTKQKEQLKTILSAKQIMMQNKKGAMGDKSCNGRR